MSLRTLFVKINSTSLYFALLVSSSFLYAQQPSSYYDRKNSVDLADSRAEKAAEQLVSLSPERILTILREEPGLLLQVKKALVREAFEQGRLLDPKELTDDALYTLIRGDDSVRVVATREIEDRFYVRAKPTLEELAKTPPCAPSNVKTQDAAKSPTPASDLRQSQPTQEDTYWQQHQGDLDCYFYQYAPNANQSQLGAQAQGTQGNLPNGTGQYPPQSYPAGEYPNSQYPGSQYPGSQYPQNQYQQSPQNPQYQQYADPRRQLQSTQMQMPGSGDDLDPSQDLGVMSDMSPEDISSLLNTGGSGGSAGFGKSGLGSSSGMGTSGLTSPFGSSMGSSLSSLLGSQGQNFGSSQFPQQASLTNPYREQFPTFPRPPDQPALRHRPNPYADVPSLYDLYAQYQKRSPVLERFGEEIFRDGTGNFDDLPMDLPAGPEYVVGPGDGLSVQLSGAVSRRIQVVVDREGRVALPEVGAVPVSGRSLGDVQRIVQTELRRQYHDIDADVSIGRIRTVRVYVVGDVERPGAYDVSSLSTPLNALYIAGGPTSEGSLRTLYHYRGKQLVQKVDVYDLLLHGVNSGVEHLEAGDVIKVAPLNDQVTVEGMVRRPAIYELGDEKSLADVLELAGGVLPSGTLRHIDVERVESHQSRTMLRLDIPENNNVASVNDALDNFKVQDGDKIKISPILPFPDKTVYLDGHVSRPGKFAYRDGMKVTDLIKSYNDLLPEPYKEHAEIIRLQAPDYAPQILAFNLADALAGNDQNLVLKPFDTVRVFGRFDFEDVPVVTVTGEVRDPGDHVTNGKTSLRDAVYLAGGTTPDAQLDDAQVFHKTSDGKMEVVSVNLALALNGDLKDNIELEPKDRVFIHKNLARTDPPIVTVEGEVERPGKYALGENMTAATLVRIAGGLKRGAYTQEADLTRYEIAEGSKIASEHVSVPIALALKDEPDADVRLRDGDVLTIRQVTGWKDLGATIKVDGEVMHPGTYGIQEGERLSSIIQRAGGFRKDAYPFGSVFEREQVRELESRNRATLIQSVQSQEAQVKLVPDQAGEDRLAKQAVVDQYQATLETLQNTPPEGRLVLHISSNLNHWANTSADIQVRDGDTIHIPKRPGVVLIDGAVYHPTGISYKPGKSAEWYLKQAGGPTTLAERKGIFVIRADGSVVGGSGGLFSGGVTSASLEPGDMVVVPQKVYAVSHAFQNTVETAQIVSAVAIAVFYAKSF